MGIRQGKTQIKKQEASTHDQRINSAFLFCEEQPCRAWVEAFILGGCMTFFEQVKQWLHDIKEKLQWFIEETDFTRLFVMLLIILICICSWTMAFLVVTKKVHAEDVDIKAIIQIESNGNQYAIGKDGEVGLMQITPRVLSDFNDDSDNKYKVNNLLDAHQNIIVGSWYINHRIPEFLKFYGFKDSIDNRLICYNAGIGTLIHYEKHKQKLPKTTINYIKKYHKLVGDI